MLISRKLPMVFLALAFSMPAYSFDQESYLLGDPAGNRAKFFRNGFNGVASYKGQVVSNMNGGRSTKTGYLGNIFLKLDIDLERASGARGLDLLISGIGNHGIRPTEYVGDIQGTTNFEAPSGFRLYEVWAQKSFLDDQLSFRFGLYDLNTEFYVTDSSAVFMNGSFGMGREFASTGLGGPSIYPNISLGFRTDYVYEPASMYVRAVVLDAVPGDLAVPNRTRVILDKNEGALLVGEVGKIAKTGDLSSKYGLGVYTYTASLQKTDGSGESKSFGSYVIVDQALNERNSVFGRFGMTENSVAPFFWNLSFGVNSKSIFPSRQEDSAGVAITTAARSMGSKETVIELTYRSKVYRGVYIQPDFQYVINPGLDNALSNSSVAGIQMQVAL